MGVELMPDNDEKAKDVNGEEMDFTESELQEWIRKIESTGRYDVVGRRW
jgi:hypothetical protein